MMAIAVRYSGRVRSPLVWVGGKYYSVAQVLAAFPPAGDYDVYCEPMGGAAHVLAGKPAGSHIEVYNDANRDLVNFWMWVRDMPEALVERLCSLPYSRALYSQYHASLYDGSDLDSLERAVRWFYVLRSSFSACVGPVAKGWGSSGLRQSKAHTYHTALSLFQAVSERFRYVQIDCRDFAAVITQYQGPRTFFYIDPPYIDCEQYYRDETGAARFTWESHVQLAALLNQTEAKVALSYYDHPQLEEWYPAYCWRRFTWETVKHTQLTRPQHEKGHEVLLMNYPESVGRRAVNLDLWGES